MHPDVHRVGHRGHRSLVHRLGALLAAVPELVVGVLLPVAEAKGELRQEGVKHGADGGELVLGRGREGGRDRGIRKTCKCVSLH